MVRVMRVVVLSVYAAFFAFRLAAQYFFIRSLTALRAAADMLRRLPALRAPFDAGPGFLPRSAPPLFAALSIAHRAR